MLLMQVQHFTAVNFAQVRLHWRRPEYGTLLSGLKFSGVLNFRRVARMAPYYEAVSRRGLYWGFSLNYVTKRDIERKYARLPFAI